MLVHSISGSIPRSWKTIRTCHQSARLRLAHFFFLLDCCSHAKSWIIHTRPKPGTSFARNSPSYCNLKMQNDAPIFLIYPFSFLSYFCFWLYVLLQIWFFFTLVQWTMSDSNICRSFSSYTIFLFPSIVWFETMIVLSLGFFVQSEIWR